MKFHFPKVPDRYDEWIELPSERVAPLYSRQFEKSEEKKATDPEAGAATISTTAPKTLTFTDLTVPENSETTIGKVKDPKVKVSKTLTLTDLTVPEQSETQSASSVNPNIVNGSRSSSTKASELPEPSISIVDSLLALRHAEPPRELLNPPEEKKRTGGVRDQQIDAVLKTGAEARHPKGHGNAQSMQPHALANISTSYGTGRIPKKQKTSRKNAETPDSNRESRVLLQTTQAVEPGPSDLDKIPRKPRNDTTKPENDSPSRLVPHSITRPTH